MDFDFLSLLNMVNPAPGRHTKGLLTRSFLFLLFMSFLFLLLLRSCGTKPSYTRACWAGKKRGGAAFISHYFDNNGTGEKRNSFHLFQVLFSTKLVFVSLAPGQVKILIPPESFGQRDCSHKSSLFSFPFISLIAFFCSPPPLPFPSLSGVMATATLTHHRKNHHLRKGGLSSIRPRYKS